MESYEYANDGTLSRRGVTVDTTDGSQLGPTAKLAISPYREGGVMIALQQNEAFAAQRADVWALDASSTSTAIQANRITSELITEDGLHGMCRVQDDKAEGDFLISTGKTAVEGIRIRALRSGPRN